jgi:ribose-phosphate pyrophosphokinase
VTGIKRTGQKTLMLFAGRAFPELALEVAHHLDIEPTPTLAYEFANGEIFVRFEESVRGCDAFVLQSHTAPINKWIMEQLIMVDALKRASAKRITVVAPFYGYARQDKKHRGREPISARLLADMYKAAGADRLMVVDLHTAQIQGFFEVLSTTCSRCRSWPSTSRASSTPRTSRSFHRTPGGCASPNAGPIV